MVRRSGWGTVGATRGGWCLGALALAGLAGLAACGEDPRPRSAPLEVAPGVASPARPPAAQAAPLEVAVTTEVGAWLARSVGGDAVRVVGALPPAADAARWQPDAAAVARLQAVDLVILNGAGLEHFAGVVSLPASRTLDLARGHRARWLYLPTVLRHSHGPGGEHVHQGVDPHLSLDPTLLQAQAEAVHRALAARRPEAQAALDAGLGQTRAAIGRWRAALEPVTARLAGAGLAGAGLAGAGLAGTGLLADHPGHAYLARSEGWDLRLVELAGAEAVAGDEAAWQAGPGARVARALAEGPAPVLLAVTPPAPAVAARLQSAHGLRVVVLPTGLEAPSAVVPPPDPVQIWIAAAAELVEALDEARAASRGEAGHSP